ncbi:MAG: hypothetical protein EPN62_08665 [Candidimonas sp.]|nr:MAG: hypothetical protein EPN77_05900 [Candidimonas sp.]TAM23739.1 MAG: hypothetical protein EPN62_08665 [Candidimonas sp.]
MTQAEALRVGREAVRLAIEKVGTDPLLLENEMTDMSKRDRRLKRALELTGHLVLESRQETRH